MRTKNLFLALAIGLGLTLILSLGLSTTSTAGDEYRGLALSPDAWGKIQAQLDRATPLAPASLSSSPAITLTAYDGEAGDCFGAAVAVSGDTVVVGSSADHIGSNENQGSIYIFERNQGGPDAWGLAAHITATNGAGFDYFGRAVAIAGDTIVVGAHYRDVGSNENQGAAYVFERDQGGPGAWGQTAYLTADDGEEGDWFGGGVAIDGDTIVVGADEDDGGGYTDRGSAYVFERDYGGPEVWGQTTHLVASPAGGYEYFGRSVAISGDTIIVGADRHDFSGKVDPGAVYVFERDQGGTGAWGQTAILSASDAEDRDRFGRSVAIISDTAAIGAYYDDIDGHEDQGSVYIFERDSGGSGTWSQAAHLTATEGITGDRLGWRVAITGDKVVSGAYSDDIDGNTDQGSAHVFGRDFGGAGAWCRIAPLAIDNGAENDQFGWTVSIAGDTVVVGSQYRDTGGNASQGAAYIFVVKVSSVYLPLILSQSP